MKKIHYVWANKKNIDMDLNLYHQISATLAKVHQPDAEITIWSNKEPKGEIYNSIKNFLKFKYEPLPYDCPFDAKKLLPAQVSDIMRSRVLNREKGLYLDEDVLILQPVQEKYWSINVIGKESSRKLCNAVFFLNNYNCWWNQWFYETNNNFKPGWGVTSCTLPMTLYKKNINDVLVIYDWYKTYNHNDRKKIQQGLYHGFPNHELVHLFSTNLEITNFKDVSNFHSRLKDNLLLGKKLYW